MRCDDDIRTQRELQPQWCCAGGEALITIDFCSGEAVQKYTVQKTGLQIHKHFANIFNRYHARVRSNEATAAF